MLDNDIILRINSKLLTAPIIAVDLEVALLKLGSMTKSTKLRNKITYLELYSFVIQTILEMDEQGLERNVTDVQIRDCIYNAEELMFNIFKKHV